MLIEDAGHTLKFSGDERKSPWSRPQLRTFLVSRVVRSGGNSNTDGSGSACAS